MNEAQWFSETVRCTIALSIAAAVLAGLTRFLKITSPRTQRIACCVVLLQGWLVIHPKLELPWGESHTAAPLDAGETHEAIATAPRVEMSIPGPDVQVRTSSTISPSDPNQLASYVAANEPSVTSTASQPDWRVPGRDVLLRLALAVWSAGMLVSIAIPLIGYGRFMRQIGGRPVVALEWLEEWRQVLAELPVRRRIELRLTAGTGPLLCWTPQGYRVLVPERLWKDLHASQRRMVLRHELAHCVRGDLWKSLMVRLLAVPHWFNPLAWWAVRRFDEAAEWVCDALAPRSESERVDFAKVLLRLCLSKSRHWSLTAAVGGRAMTARVRRVVNPSREGDAVIKTTTLAFCGLALLLAAWLRVEVVAREPEPPPATTGDAEAEPPQADAVAADDESKEDEQETKEPTLQEVDASIIEALVKQQARFATCRIQYIASQQPSADVEPAGQKEERVEFGRDAATQRWFRKANEYISGVRKRQSEIYVEQNGKRAIWVSQHNWNGLNPPMVGITQPGPESQHAFDAEPLFGLFPHGNPLSSMLEKKQVQVRTVEGDVVLQWTNSAAKHMLDYHVRLSRAHDWLPVYFLYKLDGRPIREWRATRMEQSGDVWYAAEGQSGVSKPSTFKVTRFEIGQSLPAEATRYEIPDGAWVDDQILGQRYTQGRPVATRTKSLSITVRDVADRPVEKASVQVRRTQSSRDDAGKPPWEELTDAKGVAHFDAVPDDPLSVRVTSDDVRPATIILGDGQELRMYVTPRTSGRVIGSEGEHPRDGHVFLVIQPLPMSGGEIQPPPTRSRDSTDVGANGRFELTQELTLRRLTDPLLFVAYAENGRQMAIKSVMPGELGESLNFVLQPTASVTARFDLPPGTPLTTHFGALWSDEKGRWLGETPLKVFVDSESGLPAGEAVGCLPPGNYQVRVPSTRDTDELTADFSVEPGNPQVVLSRSRLRPSQLASLRGQAAPELAATAMPPSELKPLGSLRGQVVVLNFWSWLGEKLNDHPEQTPFFKLPGQFKDKPVYWIALHSYRVSDPEALAAKVAAMRQAIWGDDSAPFASLIDESEPAPPVEVRARTATEGGVPDARRGVTRGRYGLFSGLVLIDRHGRVAGSYSQEELEPALRRLLESDD